MTTTTDPKTLVRKMEPSDVWEALDEVLYIGLDQPYTFGGYKFLGYIGNSQRNYATDTWVYEAACRVGWDLEHLLEFVSSKDGRWLLDHEPMNVRDVLDFFERAGTVEGVECYVQERHSLVARGKEVSW